MAKCEKVVFRKYPDGELIALFPNLPGGPGLVTSYMHIGQHGDASMTVVKSQTSPATRAEAAELANELESIGYRLCKR